MKRCWLVTLLCAIAWAGACSGLRGAVSGRGGARIVEIPLGDEPDGVAVGRDHVWVTVPGSHRAFPPPEGWLFKVDPATGQIVSRIRVGRRPSRVLWAGDAVWVMNSHAVHGEAEPTVMRVDPVQERVTHVLPVPIIARDVATDGSALWLLGGLGEVTRVDLAAPERRKVVRRGSAELMNASALAVGDGGLWLLEGNAARPWLPGRVSRVDPETGRKLSAVDTEAHATDVAVGLGSVWVVNRRHEETGSVSRIDARTGALLATIPVARHPSFLAVCQDGAWVSNGTTVSRIDPATNRVADIIEVPFNTRRLACGRSELWATREARDPREGSLLRMSRPGSGM